MPSLSSTLGVMITVDVLVIASLVTQLVLTRHPHEAVAFWESVQNVPKPKRGIWISTRFIR
jgi:hypothetical protein